MPEVPCCSQQLNNNLFITMLKIHKYTSPNWASNLPNIPSHFVSVSNSSIFGTVVNLV